MRVALVGNWPPPQGGVAVHVAALARSLRARGADVRVLDLGEGGHAGPALVPARGARRLSLALAGVAAERRLVHLHTSGANLPSWCVALAAGRARRPGAPRGVLTLHSGSLPAWLAGSPARRLLARAACAGFGTVVAVSEAIAAALREAGVPAARLRVLEAFSPALLEPPAPPPGLAALRAAAAPLVAAAVLPGPVYGPDLLLPAFARLRARHPQAVLAVMGQGSQDPPFRGAPGVAGLGELAHAAALAVLAAADVFVRATRVDGDALTVREALALGCRVVASDVGHRPAGCLLFPPGDAVALGEALLRAAALRRPGVGGAASPDTFEALWDVYRAHAVGRAPPPAPAPITSPLRGAGRAGRG
ncbi:MAG: glycosyltransferase [Anaeromyxobacter sp.]